MKLQRTPGSIGRASAPDRRPGLSLPAPARAQPPLSTRQAPAPSSALVFVLFVIFEGEVLLVAAFSSSANAADVASASCQGSSTISGHTTKPKSTWSR